MTKHWKRGALVGIASATILATGGGAALAGSQGSSRPSHPTASARSCPKVPFHVAKPQSGHVAKPQSGHVAKPQSGVATVPMPEKGTQWVSDVVSPCMPPDGAVCAVAYATVMPHGVKAPLMSVITLADALKGKALHPVRCARTTQIPCPRISGKGVHVRPGATVRLDPKGLDSKGLMKGVHPKGSAVVRCFDLVKPAPHR